MLKKIKQSVPASLKVRARYWLSNSGHDYFDFYRGKPKAIIALAADYANLGDVAITHAQARFLKTCLPGYEIVYLPCASTFVHMKALKRVCSPDDIITIIGGGNMSDLYHSIEDARRFVVEQFPNNRIVSFPQTIDFSDTIEGKRQLTKSMRIYGGHKNLHLFAREPVSFEVMKLTFPDTPVYLVPDIVLSLDASEPKQQRQGVIVCVRDDLESALSLNQRDDFVTRLVSSIQNVHVTDTVNEDKRRLPIQERESQLTALWSCFRQTEMVVTDRLHGMIFSAITGTPCVVLQNNNHKINATYNTWLGSLPHIRLQEGFDVSQILHEVGELRHFNRIEIRRPNLGDQFETLKKAVTGPKQ